MLNEKSATGNAVVIGAGTMGGGIAALLANAGWRVRLLDVAAPESGDTKTRNQAALAGLERVRQNKPPLLFLPEFAERIQTGNTTDDLDSLRDADWIVEAVAERPDVKRAVMAQIERNAGPDAVLSTNTSGLSLREITEGRSSDFKRRFLGTHFFNPPRYLKLLELIVLPDTDPALAAGFIRFAERVLGRRVVPARDTPGFISNRVGMLAVLESLRLASEHGLTVEEADYLTGPLIGRPKSATFRLADLIGFDIMADISKNQVERLADDPYRDRFRLPNAVQRLLESGRLGEKSGAGFYKREGGAILAVDLASLDYRPRQEAKIDAVESLLKRPLPERLAALTDRRDEAWGRYVNAVLDAACDYARLVGPEIAADTLAIDRVMRWGFNWEMGPFEIADARRRPDTDTPRYYSGVGMDRKTWNFGKAGLQPFPNEPEMICLADLKAAGRTVLDSPEASLIDLGDGAACLEFHTKMNTYGPALCAFAKTAQERAERDFAALVIGNQGPHFSAGYNLRLFLEAMEAQDWNAIDRMLHEVQYLFMGWKYAPIPVVVALHGYTLGAGCEGALHATEAQAAAELFMGLPEANVGILPAGGGTKEMLARAMAGIEPDADPFAGVERVFNIIAFPKTSGSADEARKIGFLRPTDGISPSVDLLLYEAKQRALGLANAGYRPREKRPVRVLGEDGLARLRMQIHGRYRAGMMSDHDRLIADRIAWVLSGGALPYAQEVSEDVLLQREREGFIALAHEPKSADRMRHVLNTGKPLKN